MSDDIIKRLREAIAERDELRRQLAEARAEREAMANVLPGHRYMDPPDGGDVPVLEQLRRMAKDAERYRWLRGDACPDHSVRWTQWEVRCWVAPFWSDDLRRDGLDRSIDAARAAEKCQCDMRTRLVGDGCQYCNPELARELSDDQ